MNGMSVLNVIESEMLNRDAPNGGERRDKDGRIIRKAPANWGKPMENDQELMDNLKGSGLRK